MTYTVLLISCSGDLDGSRQSVNASHETEAIYQANAEWGASVWEGELYAVWPEGDEFVFAGQTRFYAVDHTRVPYRTHDLG